MWGVACNNALSNNNISLKNLLGLEIIKSLLEFLNFIFMYCQCNESDSLYDTRMTLVPGWVLFLSKVQSAFTQQNRMAQPSVFLLT